MDRSQQLQERDVRRLAPDNNPVEFMRRYIFSNFPETASLPSREQKEGLVFQQNREDSLKLMKKPRQGTTYDNPGGF